MSPDRKAALAKAGLLGALALVPSVEGLRQVYYLDPVGIPTICFGHTGPDVKPGLKLTVNQCEDLLADDLLKAQASVLSCTKVPLSAGEQVAYTSFTYNLGRGAFCGSTLVKKLNAGDRTGACAQLSRWVYAKKLGVDIKLPGLVTRRADERAWCEGRKP